MIKNSIIKKQAFELSKSNNLSENNNFIIKLILDDNNYIYLTALYLHNVLINSTEKSSFSNIGITTNDQLVTAYIEENTISLTFKEFISNIISKYQINTTDKILILNKLTSFNKTMLLSCLYLLYKNALSLSELSNLLLDSYENFYIIILNKIISLEKEESEFYNTYVQYTPKEISYKITNEILNVDLEDLSGSIWDYDQNKLNSDNTKTAKSLLSSDTLSIDYELDETIEKYISNIKNSFSTVISSNPSYQLDSYIIRNIALTFNFSILKNAYRGYYNFGNKTLSDQSYYYGIELKNIYELFLKNIKYIILNIKYNNSVIASFKLTLNILYTSKTVQLMTKQVKIDTSSVTSSVLSYQISTPTITNSGLLSESDMNFKTGLNFNKIYYAENSSSINIPLYIEFKPYV